VVAEVEQEVMLVVRLQGQMVDLVVEDIKIQLVLEILLLLVHLKEILVVVILHLHLEELVVEQVLQVVMLDQQMVEQQELVLL
tara:strand:- start:252 stop:500 length:249 start_codon:yes stop_codon:yes gene_type:complete